jgi:hypothetical protein
MNSVQEAEFHLSIYHYFLWRSAQEKEKEVAAAAAASSNRTTTRTVVVSTTRPFATEETNVPPGANAAPVDPAEEEDDGHLVSNDANEKLVPAKPNEGEKAQHDICGAAVPIAATATEATKAGESTCPTTFDRVVVPATGPAPTATATVATNTQVQPHSVATSPSSSHSYQAVADALVQQFPHHVAHFSPANLSRLVVGSPMMMMTMMTPPIVTTLYLDFPHLQSEVFAARNRIAQLESVVQATQVENHHLTTALAVAKRKEPPTSTKATVEDENTADGTAAKRPRLNGQASATAASAKKHMSLSSRPDVPEGMS